MSDISENLNETSEGGVVVEGGGGSDFSIIATSLLLGSSNILACGELAYFGKINAALVARARQDKAFFACFAPNKQKMRRLGMNW